MKLVNPTAQELIIRAGEAIAQLLILPVLTPEVNEVEPEKIHTRVTARGSSGGITDQVEK